MQVLGLDGFSGRLNESFDVEMEHGRVPLVLVEARPLQPGTMMGGAMRAPFSLLFHHEAAVSFPQQTCTMSHAALGQFDIFLVPVARDHTGFIYQAVFN